MRRKIIIMLFLFFLLQSGPVVSYFFSDSTYGLAIVEEEVEDHSEKGKKYNKDFIATAHSSMVFSHLAEVAFHLAEKIHHPPCLEKLSPPPNFC